MTYSWLNDHVLATPINRYLNSAALIADAGHSLSGAFLFLATKSLISYGNSQTFLEIS